jgi:DNA-binding NarL/FixJ family response regulator
MVVVMKRRGHQRPTARPVALNPRKPRAKTAHERLDDHHDRIRKRYFEDGVGIYTIAREMKSSFKNLSAWMAAQGWEKRTRAQSVATHHQTRQRSLSEKTPEILRLRRDRGLSIRAIAERLDLSEKAVSAVVSAAGLGKRSAMTKTLAVKSLSGHARLDARRPEVLAAVSDGVAGYRIAGTFNVSQKTVYDWLRKNGLSVIPLTDLQRAILHLWKTTDLNRNAIAKSLGCSRTYVSEALRKAGLEDRRGIMGRCVGSSDGRRVVHPGASEDADSVVLVV